MGIACVIDILYTGVKSDPKGITVQIAPLVKALVAGWYLVLIGALLGAGGGIAQSAATTPEYSSTTKLWVSVDGEADSSALELAQGTSVVQQRINSYLDLVGQPIVLDPVISQLGLHMSSAQLADEVTASSPSGSVVIEVSVEDTDPDRAAQVAEAVAKSFTSVVQDELESGESGARVSVTQTTPPTVPTNPIAPRKVANFALGLILGVAAGTLAAFLRWALDTKIRGRADVQENWGLPILGEIAFDQEAQKRPLILRSEHASPRAEAFRALRTNVQFLAARPNGSRSIAITSSRPSEGKTTTTANLAIALADSGLRTLVIDADLRRPNLANVLGVEGASGLSDLLVGRAELEDVTQRWGHAGLHVLPAGTIPPNPSELLGSQAMAALVEHVSAEFEAILIDLPPLNSVTDAAIVSRLVPNMLLVVAAGKARRAEVSSSIEALHAVGNSVAGAIVTMSRLRSRRSGYYRYAYTGQNAPEIEEVHPRHEASGTARRVASRRIQADAS